MVVLIVDGYNMIGAWEELQKLKDSDIGQARDRLIELMAEYQAFSGHRVIIVFDAYYVRGIASKMKSYNVEIIFTKEKETADECIEKLVKEIKDIRTQVYVATSDYAEQRTIFASGALRKSARELSMEIKNIKKEIDATIKDHHKQKVHTKLTLDEETLRKFEKWRRGKL
jgi:uncharacterized protein